MANRGQPDFQILVTTTSATAAYKDISQQVDTFGGFDVEALLAQSDGFGDSWREQLYTGIRQMGDITLGGFYDDAATGVHTYFGNATDLGAERSVKLNFAAVSGTDEAKFDVIVRSYKRSPARGALTRYDLTLVPTGAMTTAS